MSNTITAPTYDGFNLPAVGSCIRIKSGALYTVEDALPCPDEDHQSTAWGFVWALRISERGTIQSAKRRRIYPYEMVEVFSPSR